MKRFLSESLLFFLLIIAVCLGVFLVSPDNQNSNSYMAEYDVKMEMLDNPDREPSIIILGGSASAFGIVSPMLEDSLGLPVINVALHAGLGQNIIVNDCFHRLKKGDIVIYSPEYSTLLGKGCGESECIYYVVTNSKKFDLGVMRYQDWTVFLENVPMRLKSKIFDSLIGKLFQSANKAEIKETPNKFTVYDISSFNSNGDVVGHWIDDTTHYESPKEIDSGLKRNKISKINMNLMDNIFNTFEDSKGEVTIILSPPCIAKSSFNKEKENIKEIASFFRKIGYPYICKPEEFVYPDSAFYDTRYHLRRYGAEKHTKHLINILRNKIYAL